MENHMQEASAKKQKQESLIGHLIKVTADHFIARMTITESGQTGANGEDLSLLGRVGSYLMVKQGDSHILVLVEAMWQEEGPDGEMQHRLKVSSVGEIRENGDFDRGVTHFPTIGAHLYTVGDWALARVFADYSDASYRVGKLSSNESVNVFFDASSFFGRHAAILGQTGSGKSWTVTSLIQSALKVMPNTHIILLDIHGEYAQKDLYTHAVSPFPEDKVRNIDAREIEIPYWLLTYAELIELFIHPDDEDAPVQISYLRETLLQLKKEANEQLHLGHVTVDTPVYFSLTDMIKMFKDKNEETADFGKTQGPLFGKFDQLLVRLQSLFNDSRYDFLLKPKLRTSTNTLAGLMRDFVGLGEPRANVTVLDLSPVPYDVLPTVTAQIGRLAYEFNFWNPMCREFPIFLICEEAHEYIPRASDKRFRTARRAMERIAKGGRKYGVGLCVVSQRPHELSETILAQCSTYVCMRITNPDDQEYVRALVPDASRSALAALTSLSRGEVVTMGEAVPMPVRFRITLPDPPPNSRDIDYAGKWRDGREDISVESLVNRWHKQVR
jgi:DNA helicase HerA-like ATPase